MASEEAFQLLRSICVIFAALLLVKYFVFLMMAPFYPVRQKIRQLRMLKSDKAPLKRPTVSVIVPAWNEEVGILRTVRSLLANTYSKIEIVVVNDGSTDKSHGIVTDFLKTPEARARHPHVKVKYHYQENGGKGKALNKGIAIATGDIIVTMDADSVFEKHAIENMVLHFDDDRIDALVGNVKVAHNPTLIGRLQQLEYVFGFYFKRAHCMLGAEYIYGGACAAFRKTATFERLGAFDDANKTEDIEMSMRTRFYGLRSVYAEDVVCYTEGASSLTGLLNQRLRWKKGRMDTFAKYRALFFSTKKEHNKFLAWFILPFTLIAELQLIIEPIGVALLTTYSILSGDYISLTLGIGFVFISYLVASLFGDRTNLKLLWWFPFTWPLFYLLVWVEYIVLLRSSFMFLRASDITWQKWERQGVEVRQ
jgi:biofilm PGA synthesis N-glycosyltransferase PgaC